MELRQLRYFVGISEAGSLLKAAARLHIAQPALGQQMAALEQELGAKLFDRSSRGMTLTEAGKTFLEHARLVLADVERARGAVRESAAVPSGDVAIGLPTTVAQVATVPILKACRQQLPNVHLKLVEAYSGFVHEWLLSGRLDVALLFGDQAEPAVAKRPLLDDRLAFVSGGRAGDLVGGAGGVGGVGGVGSAGSAGRAGRAQCADSVESAGSTASVAQPTTLAALAQWPLVLPGREHGLRRLIDEACARQGITLEVIAEIESLPNVKRAVEAGLGHTILPLGAVAEEVAAGRLSAAPIEHPSIPRRVVIATNMARPITPAAAAVVELVIEVIRGLVDSGAWPARWVGPAAAADSADAPP
jgi:LysR family nitrogen assimilation transcriptional regulator